MISFRSGVGKTRKNGIQKLSTAFLEITIPVILPCKKDRARIRRRRSELKYIKKSVVWDDLEQEMVQPLFENQERRR
jgi:hypothetical protein